MNSSIYIIPVLAFSLLLSACASFDEGTPQQVVVVSFPAEASVYIDGNATGITPLTVNLPRKLSHEIRLEKEGYNSAVKYFTPVPNDKNENFVRFGLAQDLGYYHDLEPSVMEAKMKSELVPNSTGTDPFGRMAQQALEADRQLQAGEVTPLEHKYIIEQILKFFE